MSKWPTGQLAEVAAPGGFAIGPFGSRMKTHNYTSDGARVVRGLNITQRGTIEGEFVHVSKEFADSLGSARLRTGDIALPHRGAIGRAALVTADDMVMSTSLMRVRLDEDRADPRFIAAFLASAEGEREILQFASTVGTPGIGQPLMSLRQVRVPLPPIDEQRRIAGVLGALDDLIETNRHLARALEDQMLTLFASEGFDAEPNGNSVALSDLVVVNPKLAKPAGDAPYVDMAALPTDSSRIETVARRPATGGARFQNGDTLLARLTPCLENGKAAFVDVLAPGEIAVGSTEFLVLRDRGTLGPHWPYMLTRSERFRDYAIRHMNGSSGRQRCSAESVEAYRLVSPPPGPLARFRHAAAAAFDAIGALNDEIAELSRSGDELLPLLMSGRVRVREVA